MRDPNDAWMGDARPQFHGALSAQAEAQALKDAEIEAQLAEQRRKVAAVQASQREALRSPQGLRSLFPTNHIRVGITSTTKKRQEAQARRTSQEKAP